MIKSERIISLDVFRGLIIAAMILVNYPGSWKAIYAPLKHSKWEGLTPTDFIFPFFIFIVGVSITLSFSNQIKNGKSKKQLTKKTLWRALKIFTVGMLIRFLPTLDTSRIELPGVLQRIALVFLACALIYLYTSWKTQIYIAIGILVTYWLSMKLIPVPGIETGTLELGKNLANWLDGVVIPKSLLNKKGYDSEGFYSTFPAIASGISGLLAGHILLKNNIKENRVTYLYTIGTLLILAGYIWGWFFPIIKKVWTSSFTLVTSGWAFIILALLIWAIDIKGLKKGLKPWLVFGSNAIAIYVLADVFETIYKKTGFQDYGYTALQEFLNTYNASLIWALFSLSICYLAGYILYKRRIFIKL